MNLYPYFAIWLFPVPFLAVILFAAGTSPRAKKRYGCGGWKDGTIAVVASVLWPALVCVGLVALWLAVGRWALRGIAPGIFMVDEQAEEKRS